MAILRILAQIVSAILHPLLLVTYGLLLLIWVNPFAFGGSSFAGSLPYYLEMVMRVFFSTALLPAFAIFMLNRLDLMKSYLMEEKEERIGPYIATGVFYLWIFFNTNSNPQLPDTFKVFMLSATIALFVAFFINNFAQISIYTVSMGVLISMGLSNLLANGGATSMLSLQVIFVLAGVIGSARLLLQREAPENIYGGYLAGIASYVVAFIVFTTFLQ